MTTQPYRMVRPCKKCPFRSDIAPYIRGDRAWEIVDGLQAGSEFTCHETTVPTVDEDDVADMEPGPNAAHCAGALITMEKEGFANQMMRISERLGMYDPAALDMTSPTFESLEAWAVAIEEGSA